MSQNGFAEILQKPLKGYVQLSKIFLNNSESSQLQTIPLTIHFGYVILKSSQIEIY